MILSLNVKNILYLFSGALYIVWQWNSALKIMQTIIWIPGQHFLILKYIFFSRLYQSRPWLFHCPGSAITNEREPRSCLGQVFNSKLGCFATPGRKCIVWCMQPLLKLKTRPKARPVSYSLSMHCLSIRSPVLVSKVVWFRCLSNFGLFCLPTVLAIWQKKSEFSSLFCLIQRLPSPVRVIIDLLRNQLLLFNHFSVLSCEKLYEISIIWLSYSIKLLNQQ